MCIRDRYKGYHLTQISDELYSSHCSIQCRYLQLFIISRHNHQTANTSYLLLPCPPLRSIFLSISNFYTQFLFRMWPIQFTYFLSCGSYNTSLCIYSSKHFFICYLSFSANSFHFLPQSHLKPLQIVFFSVSNRPCLRCIYYNAPQKLWKHITLCRYLP